VKSNSSGKSVALTLLGFAILVAGLLLLKLRPEAEGLMLTLPYICVGVGAGIFGLNLGTAIKKGF